MNIDRLDHLVLTVRDIPAIETGIVLRAGRSGRFDRFIFAIQMATCWSYPITDRKLLEMLYLSEKL